MCSIGHAPQQLSQCTIGSRYIPSNIFFQNPFHLCNYNYELVACDNKVVCSQSMFLSMAVMLEQLEDIYGSLFLVACDIKLVRERHRLGQKQGISVKFCSGVLLFSILIVVIWAPMLVSLLPILCSISSFVTTAFAFIHCRDLVAKFCTGVITTVHTMKGRKNSGQSTFSCSCRRNLDEGRQVKALNPKPFHEFCRYTAVGIQQTWQIL